MVRSGSLEEKREFIVEIKFARSYYFVNGIARAVFNQSSIKVVVVLNSYSKHITFNYL